MEISMRIQIVVLVSILFTLSACNGETVEQDSRKKPATQAQKQAYSAGINIGQKAKLLSESVVGPGIDFDMEMYLQGIEDALSDSLQFPEEEMREVYLTFQKQLVKMGEERIDRLRADNLIVANDFLEKNKSKEGIVVTNSGLQYRLVQPGNGVSPGPKDSVLVRYTGRLVDGTVFDTTSGSNQPKQFYVNRVVRGWTEGLQLMKEGDKFEIFVPPELGYGSQNRSKIPPNSVLVFELELLEVGKNPRG